MPYLRWDDFRARHPRAHLIVGERHGRSAADQDGGALLRTFAARREPRGDYAVCASRDGTVCLAVETDYDADMLRQALGAKSAPCTADWATRARFMLDDASRQAETSRE
jgi:hypothetical protein